eukprot:SAG22_NODE_60_length_23423_cov_8.445250_11_plen_1063_part_00
MHMSMLGRAGRGVLLFVAALLAASHGSHGQAPDPDPDPSAVVAFGSARFTVLSESLIRLEGTSKPTRGGKQLPPDDRATAVVVSRRFPGGVPRFTVTHPNSTAVVITTAKLRLTYSSAGGTPPGDHDGKTAAAAAASAAGVHPSAQPELEDAAQLEAAGPTCGCSGTVCTSASQNMSWQVHSRTQGGDGRRTPGCPNGLTNQTLDSCFCACAADPDCSALTYAPAGQDLGKSCWLLMGVTKTMAAGDRTFVGPAARGGFKGFTDANLRIDFLDPSAPVKSWHPSAESMANLNGSYTNLDCYTVPAKCAAQNRDKLQKGLLSRDGWAVWDDLNSQRLVPSGSSDGSSEWQQWHATNSAGQTSDDADVYFFGHGHNYKAALQDFLHLSGPPGMLSAPDYGVWWSNSHVFTKDQFLNRLIANFSKHDLPFTHLVMDFGWHQIQDGRLWASYTWNSTLFGDTAEVTDFIQSLHSSAASSPLGRPMALSLNLHPVGVEPAELRYDEFELQVGADPALNKTQSCVLTNETWITALFDQVLDAEPNGGVDSWWTDGTCDGGTYGGSWQNQFVFSERMRQHRELRGYVMSRWGGVGSQRYPMGFSGDQTTAWPTLQLQVETTPIAANVGFNSWSHDIGGFDCCGGEQGGGIYGKCPFPTWEGCETNSSTDSGSQLLVRWLQHGALSAVDRSHCGGCNREFWTFPNFAAMKDAMHFRIALFPYLYSENHRTRTTGVSLLHPLYYDAPHLDKSYTLPSEYFFGPQMVVQPIVAPIGPGASTIVASSWLPPGEWADWAGQTLHESGAAGLELSAEYSIHEIPIFVRAGSVIPMRTAASLNTTLAFSSPLVWGVWTADTSAEAVSGNATVVEDDGATNRFEAGQQSTTTMQWSRGDDGSLALAVAPTTGSFEVGCTAEDGIEYGGAGSDLQDVGTVASEGACCDACAMYSNCNFWTWTKSNQRCVLKVSRKGRRANASAVSGVAPRRMPTTRAHVFEVRTPQFATKAPTSVTLNGKVLPGIPPPADDGNGMPSEAAGWYVRGKQAVSSLLAPEGSLVIMTPSMPLTEAIEVKVA